MYYVSKGLSIECNKTCPWKEAFFDPVKTELYCAQLEMQIRSLKDLVGP